MTILPDLRDFHLFVQTCGTTTHGKSPQIMTVGLQQRSPRQRWAIILLATQLLVACIAWLAAWYFLETIVATGPILTIIGFAFTIAVRPRNLWAPLLVGLSAPVVCALGAFTIAAFRLNPGEARLPILIMLAIYLLVVLPAAAIAIVRILQWPDPPSPRPQPSWRYSMKSLLGMMTVVAVLTVLATAVFRSIPDFPIVFGAYSFATISLVCIVVWRFLVERRVKVSKKVSESR